VFAVLVPSVASVAVTVAVPAVFNVTLKVLTPLDNVLFDGKPAATSEDVIAILSAAAPVTIFQLASTAFTVTVKAVPFDCAVGVAPVLPVAEPAEATSPGNNICSLANAPAFMVTEGLVLELVVKPVVVAVTVLVPAVTKVTLKVPVPADTAAADGIVALTSVEVIVTVLVALLTRFQLASTTFTVTLNGVPAVSTVGVPVLPVVVPGAAVSPGNNSCIL